MKKLLSFLSFVCLIFSHQAVFAIDLAPPLYNHIVYHFGLKYGLTNIRGIYIDPSQNLWVVNLNNEEGTSDIYVFTAIHPSNPPTIFKGANYNLGIIRGIVFDKKGNAWIANSKDPGGNNSYLVEIPSSNASEPITYADSDKIKYNFRFSLFVNPLAIDRRGNIWTANGTNNSVTKLPADNPTSPVIYHSFNPYQLAGPLSIAFDSIGNMWIANSGTSSILKIPEKNPILPITKPPVNITYDAGYAFKNPVAITADSQNNIWFLSYGKVTEIPEGNPSATPKQFLSNLLFVAIPSVFTTDLKDNLWMNNQVGNLIEIPVEYNGAPFQYDHTQYALNFVTGFAPDKQGNIWVANTGSKLSDNTITELVREDSNAVAAH